MDHHRASVRQWAVKERHLGLADPELGSRPEFMFEASFPSFLVQLPPLEVDLPASADSKKIKVKAGFDRRNLQLVMPWVYVAPMWAAA